MAKSRAKSFLNCQGNQERQVKLIQHRDFGGHKVTIQKGNSRLGCCHLPEENPNRRDARFPFLNRYGTNKFSFEILMVSSGVLAVQILRICADFLVSRFVCPCLMKRLQYPMAMISPINPPK